MIKDISSLFTSPYTMLQGMFSTTQISIHIYIYIYIHMCVCVHCIGVAECTADYTADYKSVCVILCVYTYVILCRLISIDIYICYTMCIYIYIQLYTIGKVFQTSSCCNLLTLSWATDLGCIRNNHLGSATPISRAIKEHGRSW